MHTNPHNPGNQGNWNRSAIITLAICALLVLAHCDSGFVPETEPPANSWEARTETIRAWYDSVLSEEQNAPLSPEIVGKFAGDYTHFDDSTIAAVLAAMVRQHPPEWDKIEVWDNRHGGYFAATLLSGNPTSPSDPQLSIVRTLVADVDGNGNVLSGILVEFIARDLEESLFRDYVVQWLFGEFDNTPMLVSEYTVGYASTQAMYHAPGEAPRPMTMQLVEKVGTGKAAAKIWFC